MHHDSLPCAAFDSRAPLLPSPLPSLAPTQQPMPSGCSCPGSSSTSGGVCGSSSQLPLEWVLELTGRMEHLERRATLSDPSMVSSSTTQSSQFQLSGTQSPWILNSGASFHMAHDSIHQGSMSSLPSHVYVKTVDGTSLPVVSLNTLRTPQFHVSYVNHVLQHHLQLFYVGQITDHGCHVILDSDACSTQDHHNRTLVGSDRRLHNPPCL
jgi:hypothetical protein